MQHLAERATLSYFLNLQKMIKLNQITKSLSHILSLV